MGKICVLWPTMCVHSSSNNPSRSGGNDAKIWPAMSWPSSSSSVPMFLLSSPITGSLPRGHWTIRPTGSSSSLTIHRPMFGGGCWPQNSLAKPPNIGDDKSIYGQITVIWLFIFCPLTIRFSKRFGPQIHGQVS